MEIEEDPPIAIPEWVVTFGDMMSLLLTFFIMLVSLSEIKQEDKFQALVEAFRQQFGHDMSMDSLTPGDTRPRSTAMTAIATMGRAKTKNTAKGGTEVKAPHGEEQSVRIIRQGSPTAVGSVVFFETGSEVLSDTAQRELLALADQLRGKPQKIEVRGHTAPEVAARNVDPTRSMDLSYRRAVVVTKFLISKAQIEPYRFRLAQAGENEPIDKSGNVEKMGLNPRVEVFLLDEIAEDQTKKATDREIDSTIGDTQTGDQ